MDNEFLNGSLCALLSSMYLCKPTHESLANWRQLLMDEPLAGAEELKEALDAINLDSEEELEELLWDYTRLFIGPYHLPCPPLESVYTSPKRLMMQDAYDEVRECYSLIGVEIGNADVMPDHIGAELNFLAILLDRKASESGIQNQYKELAETFLMIHLRNWVPRFTADMEEASKTPFYKALAKSTREAVA
jgi:putative dimethyl sulfoxide reductase chaperone